MFLKEAIPALADDKILIDAALVKDIDPALRLDVYVRECNRMLVMDECTKAEYDSTIESILKGKEVEAMRFAQRLEEQERKNEEQESRIEHLEKLLSKSLEKH